MLPQPICLGILHGKGAMQLPLATAHSKSLRRTDVGMIQLARVWIWRSLQFMMTQVQGARGKRYVPFKLKDVFGPLLSQLVFEVKQKKKKRHNTKTSPAQNRSTGTATGHIWTLDPGNSKGPIVAGEKAQSNRNLTKDQKRNNISESWRSSKNNVETCWDSAITTITMYFFPASRTLRTESLKRPCSSDSCFCTTSPLATIFHPWSSKSHPFCRRNQAYNDPGNMATKGLWLGDLLESLQKKCPD